MNDTSVPVLLLHGIPGSRRSWDRVVPLLEPFRIVVPDLLGFGESPDVAYGTHAAENARAILDLMNERRLESVHVVGFDFGGPVAVMLHALAPHRISRMTLMATNVLADTPVPLPLRAAHVPLAGELLFRALFSRLGLMALWAAATGDRRAFPLRSFLAAVDARGNATARSIFLDSLRRLGALYGPIEAELSRIRVPVTVVWGDRDPFFPLVVGERTAAKCGAALHILPGCGHWLPQERPREVAGIIAGDAL